MKQSVNLFFFVLLLIVFQTNAQTWDSLRNTLPLTGRPISMCDDGSRLYVGRDYSIPGDHYIEIWDGMNWDSTGIDCDGQVASLVMYRGRLTSCSQFQGISQWDGNNWIQLGGIQVRAHSLYVHDTLLYAIGAGGTFVYNQLAFYDGTLWSTIDTVQQWMSGFVDCATFYHNELYISGNFVTPDGLIWGIARWDGQLWHRVGNVDLQGGGINCMTVYNDELYIGGSFQPAGFSTAGILKWNGQQWMDVGGAFNSFFNTVHAFCIFQDRLIVSGIFDNAGSIPASNIASWDGAHWCSSNATFNNRVVCLHEFNNKLYISGGFELIGSDSIRYIASTDSVSVFSDTCSEAVGIAETDNNKNISVFPNPATEGFNIELNKSIHTDHVHLKIFNSMGQVIVNESEIIQSKYYISCENWVSGIYLIQIYANGYMLNHNVIKK